MTLTFARRHETLHRVLNDLNTHIFLLKKSMTTWDDEDQI